jgi:uncharacterized protein YcbX
MLLSRIVVYPDKFLDGVCVEGARLTSGGILETDCAYAFLDERGAYADERRFPRAQQIRTGFDHDFLEVYLWRSGEPAKGRFSLREPASPNRQFSAFLGFPVKLTCESRGNSPSFYVSTIRRCLAS